MNTMQRQEGEKIGVLLGQVGTPTAPTKKALRTYLSTFLSDPRVVDMHPVLWKLILHGIVLRFRPAHSARMYESIWTDEGSALLVHSLQLQKALQDRLGSDYVVKLGMAYSTPSISSAVQALDDAGIRSLKVLPLFPQFSTTTTASIFDEVYAAVSGRRWSKRKIYKKHIPPLFFSSHFYNQPEFIRLLSTHIRTFLDALPEAPQYYVLTFHGLPKRYVEEGDPYKEQCRMAAQLLAEAMGWNQDEWEIVFQSRFGRQAWLEPYAEPRIRNLHTRGINRPAIVPLSFVTDCLETIYELGMQYRKVFAEGGGDPEKYTLVPCLNQDPAWVEFLASQFER